jgi:hypothetical protein
MVAAMGLKLLHRLLDLPTKFHENQPSSSTDTIYPLHFQPYHVVAGIKQQSHSNPCMS